MNRRTLLILVAATLALVALLYAVPSQFDEPDGDLLIPGLKDELNDLEKLTLTTADNRTVATLERGATQWTVSERHDYPANVGNLRHNLIALANATIAERKTADPANYNRLGVEDVSLPGASGVELKIFRPGQSEPFGVIVGDTGVRGDMAYVRRSGEQQALMVSAALNISKDTIDWLDRDIMNIPPDEVRAVTITHPDGATLKIEKAEPQETDFSVLGIPDGGELAYDGVANPIGGFLSLLQFDDVSRNVLDGNDALPKDDSADSNGEGEAADEAISQPVVARFETFDGLVIEASAYTRDDELEVSFRASSIGDDKARSEELNTKLDGWLYYIPSYKTEQLVKRVDDLLKSQDQ